ncbi:MAG TPA: NAD(P)H-dependent oxidoreductase [Chitinophagales bacterium]|jgi:chromate reductase|nr:NAD(P)H-dependent oxidoreductase [Chitinophagales bacterium]MBP6154672.1 NAD(P)H-dependent oxidoreductase [Chitinophagales bacterium]HQV77485.1 NAD(P)H-dependent oxidoreductase [Chitinophagales bacterium]HQW78547.1 NAD(P)H-dependent oxidoreductase [Chitinophagales bacterium]HRB67524.1 NAD(P)H-dependent oxidoreductase [Chitinophagales bacterium]
MLTIFHATARPNSYSRKIADLYSNLLTQKEIEHRLFTLESVKDSIFNHTYQDEKTIQQVEIEDTILAPTTKFIFVVPEYNGSFPGMFKAFIDATDLKKCFFNKKACLVGVAEGRAGNLRGMEHLTNIFNHIKMNVLHLKIPISQVSHHFDENGNFTNTEILKLCDAQINSFLEF